MPEKCMMIWGAGKIGRGFLADLFASVYEKLIFVDASVPLIEMLNERKKYTILKLTGSCEEGRVEIDDFCAVHSDDPWAVDAFTKVDALAVALFPEKFPDVAEKIVQGLIARETVGIVDPLDVYICANISNSKILLRDALKEAADLKHAQNLLVRLRLAECIVIRMAVEPSLEQLQEDPLIVVTNGYPELIADACEFVGDQPEVPGIVFTDNIEHEKIRKLYTYNMMHAFYSYVGSQKGHTTIYECTQDPDVQTAALGALEEASEALVSEYSFTEEDMRTWNEKVVRNMKNPMLNDTLARVGSDPARKLGYGDRLVGPAMLCIRNGIYPYYLSKAIAGAFLSAPELTLGATVQQALQIKGIRSAAAEFCGLQQEPALVQMIVESFVEAQNKATFNYNVQEIALLKRAYASGFQFEKMYRGCAQCTLLSMFNLSDSFDAGLFRCATGFSGGMAITGDGVCGGYSGGLLFMGKYVGRRYEQMVLDGDKEEQYHSYDMSQQLRDLFVETFGSVICADIHRRIFGESFCLRTKPVRDRFEEAGAHTYKCTTVIAIATMFIARIMLKEGFLSA